MKLEEIKLEGWSGFIWLRIGTGGGVLNFRFHRRQGLS
jgi:hypothetical protein